MHPLMCTTFEPCREDIMTDRATAAETQEFNDPVEAIRFYMAERGLKQRDLVPMIGSRSKVSEVLSGTRMLTMPMARALHQHLGIPADVLLKEPDVHAGTPENRLAQVPTQRDGETGLDRTTGQSARKR